LLFCTRAQLSQRESADDNTLYSTSEAFRGLTDEIARGAAQDKKPGWRTSSISEHQQYGKKIRTPLNFIDYDQSLYGRWTALEQFESQMLMRS